MSKNIQPHAFACQFLEQAILYLEHTAQRQHYNWYCMRDLIILARFLKREELVPRVMQLWHEAATRSTDPADLDDYLDDGILSDLHPPYPADALPSQVVNRATLPLIVHCLERRYEKAYREARDDLDLEDIAATQAVLGDFDMARATLQRIGPERESKRLLMLITVVELFRRGSFDQMKTILDPWLAQGIDMWEYVHLAYGFAGREPWGGYPYADY